MPEPAQPPVASSVPCPEAPGYTVRRLRPEDAPAVVECVRAIYGDSYAVVHPELYDPGEIVRLNQTGRLVSVVAMDALGKVAGHYGLERPDLGPVAETGEAMVRPEHRRHHLMERMREVVIEEARRLRLAGVFGQAVTNHVVSQKMYEHFPNAHPCGVLLAQLPTSFHNLPEPPTQRISSLIYFRYLEDARALPAHAPPCHGDMVARIYRQFGIEPEFAEAAPAPGEGQVAVSYDPALQVGLIQVQEGGSGTAARLRQARRELCGQGGAAAVYLELPLAQPATPALCEAAERDGFFFAGLFPHFASGGDALRLQFVNVELDTARLQIESAFAKELVAYVTRERERVTRPRDP